MPEEAFAGLVTAPVFKTGEASETMLGGFDSHPLPLLSALRPLFGQFFDSALRVTQGLPYHITGRQIVDRTVDVPNRLFQR